MWVWFGKLGEMVLVSYLDLVRLFVCVVCWSDIFIVFIGGYYLSLWIVLGSVLFLGVISIGEMVDFELIEIIDVVVF